MNIADRQEEFRQICEKKAGRGLYPGLDTVSFFMELSQKKFSYKATMKYMQSKIRLLRVFSACYYDTIMANVSFLKNLITILIANSLR